jgi:UDP-N-acetyl-2-amino-2-deoxyglucuronate dehydrogenase
MLDRSLNPTPKVRTGIIGCGKIARTHAHALSTLEESSFAAVCDAVRERAQALASEFGVPHVFTSAREMLGSGLVEAVNICVPHPLHAEMAIMAAEAGVHAITEKPLTVNLREADAMIAAHRRAGTKLACIFQRRFWPAAQRLRRAIDEGKLGERLVMGDCIVKWCRTAEYYQADPWRGRWDTEGGGVLVNQAVHAIDMYQWYMGPVDTIYAQMGTFTHDIEVEDNAVATLRFQSGALGVIQASVSHCPTLWSRITVLGSNGAAASVLEQPEGAMGRNDIWTVPGEEHLPEQWWQAEQHLRSFPTHHVLQIKDFLQAIREGREPAVTGEEGRKAVEIILAIYRSARSGEPVKLPLPVD